MDLLGSILGSMDKPPSASERDKKIAKEIKAKQEKELEKEKKKRQKFKENAEKKIAEFIDNPTARKLKFPPDDKIYRSILHEIAEAAGLMSFSFGTEEVDKHIVLYKKEDPPTDEELQALRNGEDYDPSKHKPPATEGDVTMTSSTQQPDSRQPQASMGNDPSYRPGASSHYQEKYKHLLGGLECAEQSAVKMSPNKSFGYVPSSNKRDVRSIEQTLNDMRSRKKPRLDKDTDSSTVSEQQNGLQLNY